MFLFFGKPIPSRTAYSMSIVGELTAQRKSVGKLPGPCVGTLQVSQKTAICRNFAYASLLGGLSPPLFF